MRLVFRERAPKWGSRGTGSFQHNAPGWRFARSAWLIPTAKTRYGPAALANGGRISASTAAYTEVTGALLETHVAENSPDVVFVFEPGNDSYDPYTCAAAYGDEFCDAFERCLAAHGFDRCYKRFSQ